MKKHRWHKKILKTNEAVLCSTGWRRFQTLPIFSLEDSNGRMRMLKYTPEHLHCFATLSAQKGVERKTGLDSACVCSQPGSEWLSGVAFLAACFRPA